MQLLKDRILRDGKVMDGDILKVDSFLNHQIDVELLEAIGKEFKRLFADKPINKILTIESSGIAIACATAKEFGIPVVFAKKTKSLNIAGDVYTTPVRSYTHNTTYDIIVSHKFLGPDDNVLIIDDFLANGKAIEGLIKLVRMADANLIGAGVVIEKGYQPGGAIIRDLGIDLKSLAIIDEMSTEKGIRFRN